MSTQTISEVRRGAMVALPMVLSFIPIGLIMGITASQVGLNPWTTALMASVNFAGGSEFAALALWSAIPPIAMIVMTTWLVNSRYIMLGAALTPYLKAVKTPKALLILHLMCDESWAIGIQDAYARRQAGHSDETALSLPFYFGASIFMWLSWWVSATLGCLMASMLGDLSSWGVSSAFPAMFITLVMMMWPGKEKCMPAIASGVVSALSSLVFSSTIAVMLGIFAGIALAWWSTGDAKK